MKRVELLPIDALASGMIVAEPLMDTHGRVLVAEGFELSEIFIARLSQQGVKTIMIEHEVTEDPLDTEAYRAGLEQRLGYLFRHAGDGVETRALYAAVLDYRMEHRQ